MRKKKNKSKIRNFVHKAVVESGHYKASVIPNKKKAENKRLCRKKVVW